MSVTAITSLHSGKRTFIVAFSHATIAAMCSPLYLIWLGFTMSVVVLSQKQKGLDPMQGVQPFCVYVPVEAAGYSCLPNINRLMPKITVITKAW
jgi:hypothetical protein